MTESTLGQYRLRKLLGRGGMGEVYLAERQGPEGMTIRCVVKTMIPQGDSQEIVAQLFMDEARTCTHLRHPNVVSIIDVGWFSGKMYIAMEWVDGLDANQLLKLAAGRGMGIPLNHTVFIIREALKGLHHAHTATAPDGTALNIVHRDISPGNILISRQGAVKLADFGVAFGKASKSPYSADL
ncbi:MAG: serine/threonine protein kinase, partial [Deltaproteobacteria bacterium]